jgi:hypothetical protein
MATATATTDKWGDVMDQAYDRWSVKPHWTKRQFLAQLNDEERFAVCTGNLNYQVTNGGFVQWKQNGYGTLPTCRYLIEVLGRLGTDAANKAVELLKRFLESRTTHPGAKKPLSALDEPYYEICQQLGRDIEAALHSGAWKAK